MVGLSCPTIRSWERRHPLGSPQRSHGNQRRYSLPEVELLKRVKELTAQGMPIRLAIQVAQGGVDLSPPIESLPADPIRLEDGGVWRAVADLMPRPVVILERRGRVLDCNRAFARACHLRKEDLQGREFTDLVLPQHRAKAVQLYRGGDRRLLRWELNLVVQARPRLYSFESWPVLYRGNPVTVCAATAVPG